MTLSRGQRLKAAAIAAAATPLVEAIGATYSWREAGADRLTDLLRRGDPPILALWHGRILAATLYFRDRGVVALTSQNFDGEWIAGLMRRFGYGAARGSTSRGGARALVQMRRSLGDGHIVAFTVDGPRGPARIAQLGALWLAGSTGRPILPFHIEASAYWTLRSWDRHQIPKPGARVAIAIGEPMHVAGTDEETLERERTRLEGVLLGLERQTVAMLSGGQ